MRGGGHLGHFSYISLHVDKNIFLLVSATLWSLSAIGLPEFGAVVFLLFSPPFPFHPFYVLFSPLFSVSLSRFPALCDVTCGFKSCMVVYYRNTFLPSTLLTALFSPFPNFSIIIRPQTHKKKIA